MRRGMTAKEKQLAALRASVVSILAQVDALIAQEEEAPAISPSGVCSHRDRLHVPVMGDPEAWLCNDCAARGSGDTVLADSETAGQEA